MSNYNVTLVGPAPWGFRLQGGKDFNMPLTISRLNDGGKAAQANIGIGDLVLTIDGISTDGMTHLEAQNKIKACSGSLRLTLQKATPKPSPNPAQTVPTVITNTPLKRNTPSKRPPRKHIMDTYSDFQHTPSYSENSKQRLMDDTEDWHPRTGTTQSRSFRILAQMTGTENMNEPEPENVNKPKERHMFNGDIRPSEDLPRETENQMFLEISNKCSIAIQTDEVSEVTATQEITGPLSSLQPVLSEKSESEVCLPSLHTMSSAKPSSDQGPPHGRKTLYEHPLESLPKCAPFPPATVNVFSANAQVATISNTASVYMRSTTVIPDSPPDLSILDTPMMNGTDMKNCPAEKFSVATQTVEYPAALSSAATESAVTSISSLQHGSMRHISTAEKNSSLQVTSLQTQSSLSQTSMYSKKCLMENSLENLPKGAPCPPPVYGPSMMQDSKRKTSAVAAVSAVVGAQARLSDPFVYRSLLDALLITPITKPSFPNSKPSRKSCGVVFNEQNTSSDSQEPVQMTAYTAASAKSMPASYKSPQAYKPSGTTSVSKPATVQPPAQPAPSFGKISNNSATAVKSDVSNKPVGPPPPADQDTLFQRAEHIPAGKRTPMCAICDLVIRGPFLLALGKSWHKEEFNCAHCKINMAEMGFVQEKGSLYCEVCYAKFFAPDCARCQRKILGEVINALKQAWHVSCFVCVACNKPIRNGVFHLEDGEPYCETDYYSMFGTMCHGCEFPVEAGDRFLEALGHTWHNTCFVCTVCCESLEGKTFFSKKDKPLCKKHAHVVNI